MARKLTGHGTKTTNPIKSKADIQAMHHYFLNIAKSATTHTQKLIGYRNWFFFALGINLGYRGGDITELTWDKLIAYNPTTNTYTVRKDEYNRIHAEKTGKSTILYFNSEAERCINFYLRATGIKPTPNTPVFFSRKSAGTSEASVAGHIDCDNMGRIIKKAAKACNIAGNICTHTLRKTFGYQYYQATGDIITLQKILGHENPGITLTYIGITAEDIMHAYDVKPDTCIDDLESYLESPEVATPEVATPEAIAPEAIAPKSVISNIVPMRVKPVRHHSNFYSNYKYQGCDTDVQTVNPQAFKCRPSQSAFLCNVPAARRCSAPQWQGACATD